MYHQSNVPSNYHICCSCVCDREHTYANLKHIRAANASQPRPFCPHHDNNAVRVHTQISTRRTRPPPVSHRRPLMADVRPTRWSSTATRTPCPTTSSHRRPCTIPTSTSSISCTSAATNTTITICSSSSNIRIRIIQRKRSNLRTTTTTTTFRIGQSSLRPWQPAQLPVRAVRTLRRRRHRRRPQRQRRQRPLRRRLRRAARERTSASSATSHFRGSATWRSTNRWETGVFIIRNVSLLQFVQPRTITHTHLHTNDDLAENKTSFYRTLHDAHIRG